MRQVTITLVVSTLLLSGCLRSSMLIVHEGGGRATVSDTILMHEMMVAMVPGAIPDSMRRAAKTPEEQAQLLSKLDPSVLVDSLPFWTTDQVSDVRIERIADGDFIGVILTATVSDIRGLSMTWSDVAGRGGPQDALGLMSFRETDGTLQASVSPRGVTIAYPNPEVDTIPDSELAQFRIFGAMRTQGMRFRIAVCDKNDTTEVLFIDGERGMQMLAQNDERIEQFLLIRQRTDEEIIDYVASVPDSIVRIPSVTEQASPGLVPMDIRLTQPKSTREDSLSALLGRIAFTTTAPNLRMMWDLPPEMSGTMGGSDLDRMSKTPLQFGGSLDTMVRDLGDLGGELTVSPDESGRTISVHDRATWHRRYDLYEDNERGLIRLIETAWFDKEPRFRLVRMAEYFPRRLKQSGARDIQLHTVSDTLFHVTYSDPEFGPMEDRVFTQEDPGKEPDKPWALVSIRRRIW